MWNCERCHCFAADINVLWIMESHLTFRWESLAAVGVCWFCLLTGLSWVSMSSYCPLQHSRGMFCIVTACFPAVLFHLFCRLKTLGYSCMLQKVELTGLHRGHECIFSELGVVDLSMNRLAPNINRKSIKCWFQNIEMTVLLTIHPEGSNLQ